MQKLLVFLPLLSIFFLWPQTPQTAALPHQKQTPNDTIHIDQEYALKATIPGYFAKDGSRNPTLPITSSP